MLWRPFAGQIKCRSTDWCANCTQCFGNCKRCFSNWEKSVFCCYFKLRNTHSFHCSLENSFSVTFLSLICNYPVHNYQWQISYSVLMKYKFICQGWKACSVLQFVSCKKHLENTEGQKTARPGNFESLSLREHHVWANTKYASVCISPPDTACFLLKVRKMSRNPTSISKIIIQTFNDESNKSMFFFCLHLLEKTVTQWGDTEAKP